MPGLQHLRVHSLWRSMPCVPSFRRGSSVVTPSGSVRDPTSTKPSWPPTALKRGTSVACALRRGSSLAAAGSPDSPPSSNSSPASWSEPAPGVVQPLGRRSSVTFSPEIRRNVRLSPLSPRRTGSGVPLLRGPSGALQRSPNRSVF